MMAKYDNIFVKGIDDFLEKLDRMGKSFNEIIDPVSKKGAEVVLSDAIAECPTSVDGSYNSRSGTKNPAGYLKNSLGIKKESSRKYKSVYKVGPMAKDAYYGVFVEYGVESLHIGERPFLRPALDKNKDAVERIVQEGLEKVINANSG